jgi:hypothetical protein
MIADEATGPTNRSERLKATFLSLSNESQTFMLGQAEGLRVAQTLLREPLPTHGSPVQERWQRPDAGDMGSAGGLFRR